MNKSLIILRGLPGAGKSTLAKVLAGKKYPIFSVDDYFTNTVSGEYQFDFSKNHLAYQLCLGNCEAAMKKGVEKIFLDNVFSLDWEIEPYFKLAQNFSYTTFVLTVENYHGNKNVHDISDEQIKKIASKYKVKLIFNE